MHPTNIECHRRTSVKDWSVAQGGEEIWNEWNSKRKKIRIHRERKNVLTFQEIEIKEDEKCLCCQTRDSVIALIIAGSN